MGHFQKGNGCFFASLLARLDQLQRAVIDHRSRALDAWCAWRLNVLGRTVVRSAPLAGICFHQREAGRVEHGVAFGVQLLHRLAHDDGISRLGRVGRVRLCRGGVCRRRGGLDHQRRCDWLDRSWRRRNGCGRCRLLGGCRLAGIAVCSRRGCHSSSDCWCCSRSCFRGCFRRDCERNILRMRGVRCCSRHYASSCCHRRYTRSGHRQP